MDGITVGFFGTDRGAKAALESSVAKKSEAHGITVFTRSEGGRRYSLLDTDDYRSQRRKPQDCRRRDQQVVTGEEKPEILFGFC